MANPRIEVEIGANVAGLTAGVNTATGQLDKLGKAAQSTAPQIQKLSQATSGYNSIGTDFARIIQDAPFGIIGIGNNIQQLAGSFQTLKNQTGSTSAALKQSFASIFSSGNALVLGISLLTTAFTVLQQNGFFKTEKSAKSLQDRLQEYRDTLESVTRASIEGQANAAKEIQSFSLLRAQAENTNVSLENRIEAVKDLKKQYPEYLKGLTDEQVLTGQVGDAYTKLTAGLIATAKARAASDQIAKNSLDVLTLITQEDERSLEIKQLQIEKTKALADADKQTARDRYDFIVKAEGIQRNINDLEEENNASREERNKIAQQEIKLTDAINQGISQGAIFTKETTKARVDDKKALDAYKESWDEYNLAQESANLLAQKFTLTQDELGKKISQIFAEVKPVEVKINTNVSDLEQEIAPILPFLDQLETALNPKKFTDFEQRVSDFAFAVRDLLQNNLANAFIDLGYTIGEALATGGNVIQAVGQSVLKSFGRFLGQFGEQLIAYGVATIAFGKASIGLSNPFTAIPSGGLAIAAGVALTAISGIIGSLGKKGMGGGGGGGGGGSVGSSGVGGGSNFVGGGAQGGMFATQRDLNGELVVRGQDLVYVFGQASNRINKG